MRYIWRVVGFLAACLLAAYAALGIPASASSAPAPASSVGTPGSAAQVSPWGHGQGAGQAAPPRYQPHDTITRISGKRYHYETVVGLPHGVEPTPYAQQYWSGHGVTADSGVDINKIQADVTLPTINCSDTYIGSSGYAMMYDWVGIDGYGTGDVEQTGFAAWCSGTPGDLGSGSASYDAWYTIVGGGSSVWPGLEYFSPPGGTLVAGAKLQFTAQWDSATSKYEFTLGYGTNYGSTITDSLACPSGGSCGFSTAEATLEQPSGSMPGYPLPEWSGGGGWNNVAITSSTGTTGSLDALAGYWNPVTFNMIYGSPVIAAGDTTDGYGDPGALNPTGTSFAANCTYYGSDSQLNWTPCPTSPSFGVDWREVVASHTPDYIVGNGHNNRATWTSTQSSGTNLMPEFDGTSGGYDVLTFFDGPRDICLLDGGSSDSYHVYEESCPSGDTSEEWKAEPASSITYSGYDQLVNVATGKCLEMVTGTGDYLNDVTCPSSNAADEVFNPFWFDGDAQGESGGSSPYYGNAACLQTIVPEYSPALWSDTVGSAPEPAYVIANWGSNNYNTGAGGPGTAKVAADATQISDAESDGATVLGYIATDEGTQPAGYTEADIEDQMQEWESWYGVTNFFLDEVPTGTTYAPVYSALLSWAQGNIAPTATTWLNMGAYPAAQSWMSDGTEIGDWENSTAPTTPPSWVFDYPASDFFGVMNDTADNSTAIGGAVSDLEGPETDSGVGAHIGIGFVTDDDTYQTYSTSYWDTFAGDAATPSSGSNCYYAG
jgi:hypothetical protein